MVFKELSKAILPCSMLDFLEVGFVCRFEPSLASHAIKWIQLI